MKRSAQRMRPDESSTLLSTRGWFSFGGAFALLGVVALVFSDSANKEAWWLHGLWCLAGVVLSLPILFRTYRTRFAIVLIDHRVVFTIAFACYFLFGASLLSYGPEGQIADAMRNYPVNASDALQVDAINALGFALALIASVSISGAWLGRQADRVALVARRMPTLWVMVVLMSVGGLASINAFLSDFGTSGDPVSGIGRAASQFVFVAIFLGTSYRGSHEIAVRVAALVLGGLQVASGVLLFNKTSMLLPLATLMAGLSLRYGLRRVVPAGVTVLAILFVAVGGAMSYGRNALRPGTPHSLRMNWDVFQEGLAASRANDDAADYNAWGRLCYIAPQVAAFDFYNAGLGGDQLRMIPWVFIPRLLAPQKPVITYADVDFNDKMTGSTNSSTGMGIFVSGYYSAGWFGVMLAALACGGILAQTSAVATAILARRATLLLPLALLGVYMAFRIDGNFVADYIGSFVFLLYPLVFLSAVYTFHRRRD